MSTGSILFGSFHLSLLTLKDTTKHRVTSRDVAARALLSRRTPQNLEEITPNGACWPWPPVAVAARRRPVAVAARGRPSPPVAVPPVAARGRPSPPVAVAARRRPWPWPPVAARRHFRTIFGKRKIDFLTLF